MDTTAIVYVSNTGYTKKYADLLSEAVGLPAYSLDEAKTKLSKGDKIVFLGWLMAGFIQGFKKAAKRYDVKLLAGVGMASATESERARIANQNKYPLENFTLLQGGFDINKLTGKYKFMMTTMKKTAGKALSNKENRTAEEDMMLDLMMNGGDRVNADALSPIIAKLN